ncbi:hypothetical protein EFV37_22155 [Mesorhizobium loti]|uniref:Uncharacterized protein n=1 Tax=Mesorhizobium jarvisii TaxID=1777867 RepID=A0A6M7TKR6_9HYPH|nr:MULTISPECIES: hypothetical protein [Mesorhizobium]OBQ59574.1 hypothetical protein A9K72_25515 [Mesorhizobium loti]QKC64688.1 hypothetical protein EB229_22150 [Mesorhizobium jarvisii]QKD10602.1 hypothetical protein EFV37_22155 [Mesorhizobium loti]RJT30592.1 hypothetical protein D3242_24785 [Mesorhizobium jarvisii]
MVARPSSPTRSCNAGEFTPEAKGRIDIKQYYSAGLAFKGVEPVPQSGFRRMGGSRRVGKWRKPLSVRAITSPTPAAGPFTGTQIIWTGTVAGTVAAVLASTLAISAGTATFTIEAFVGGGWVAVGGPFAVKTGTPVTRLAAYAPGQQKAATSLRIVATFSTGGTTVSGLTVSAFFESGTALRPRYVALATDQGDALSCYVTAGIADFFTEAGFKGSARLATVTPDMLPDLGFYSEGSTIGIFHAQLETVRLFLATAGQLQDWRQDLWPYDPVPSADLGGVYAKTDDKWDFSIRYIAGVNYVSLSCTVNGETTPAVFVPRTGDGAPADIDPDTPDWPLFATRVQTALRALPTMSSGLTVTVGSGFPGFQNFIVTFGGDLSGEEYEFSAIIANTSDASVLPYHTQIGKTETEAVFSTARGWPGGAELVQDRLDYYRIPAVTGAMAMSRVAEYFDLNIEGKTDATARLDKLRSQTSETIVHVKESSYLFTFTDRAMYFVPNRTIERNTPLNFVPASEIGAQPNCKPFTLEGEVYYVAINPQGLAFAANGGKQVLRITEAVTSATTNYNADPVSLLASHLADNLIRSASQKPATDLDASKGWLMRTDGRLIACQMIRNQDINGYCEWLCASGGLVREIGVDGKNRLWLANERAGGNSIEIYDTSTYLQDAVTAVPDLGGVITGLDYEDGAELWANADGYVLGPFTCVGGSISLGDAYASALVGRWIAPRWESMPQVLVVGNDDVILRPGRIHTLHINIADTDSIAVGANGEPPQDIILHETTDLVDAPMPLKTKLLTVGGDVLLGMMEGTTAVITQKRPGELRVRDIAMGTKL